jgi:hypothetical protein
MDDVSIAISKAEQELLSLPRDYTPEMALANGDILYDRYLRSYNLDRLILFINNVYNGIPDYIRITRFGMDGPATVIILQYNGDVIMYTLDVTRYSESYTITTDFGHVININSDIQYGHYATVYYLISDDGKTLLIFRNTSGI